MKNGSRAYPDFRARSEHRTRSTLRGTTSTDPRPLNILWFDPRQPQVPRLASRLLRPEWFNVQDSLRSLPELLECLSSMRCDLLVLDESAGDPREVRDLLIEATRLQPDLRLARTAKHFPPGSELRRTVAGFPVFQARKPIVAGEFIDSLRTLLLSKGEPPPLEPRRDRNPLRGSRRHADHLLLQGLRVLWVDSSCPAMAGIVRKLIDRLGGGGVSDVAVTVDEALDRCESAPYDVVVIDRNLLEQEDAYLLRALTTQRYPPAIGLTGGLLRREFVTQPPYNECIFALEKPFDLVDLVDCLAACRIERRRG